MRGHDEHFGRSVDIVLVDIIRYHKIEKKEHK